MGQIAYSINNQDTFPVISLVNYCTNETLEGLGEKVCDLCDDDKNLLIFDFKDCQIINSLGLATLLEVLMMIQDYEGKAVITGLDATKEKFFSLTGVFSIAETASDIEAGKQILKTT
jgi:anti-anti-sigma regulatory factor